MSTVLVLQSLSIFSAYCYQQDWSVIGSGLVLYSIQMVGIYSKVCLGKARIHSKCVLLDIVTPYPRAKALGSKIVMLTR